MKTAIPPKSLFYDSTASKLLFENDKTNISEAKQISFFCLILGKA